MPLVLLMGSERQGLSAEQQAICDLMVRIPMVGQSDSLNLSVATAVVLYEIFRQTHPDGG
jgi:TrmH family RNA methyltransferase